MNAQQAEMLFNLSMLLALLLLLALWWGIRFGGHRGRIAQRVREAAHAHTVADLAPSDDAAGERPGFASRVLARVAALGDRLPLFDAGHRLKLRVALLRAGFHSRSAVSVLVGAKFITGLLCATLTVLFGKDLIMLAHYPAVRALMMLAAFVVGMIVPEYAVAFLAARRRRRIAAFLPDALDLFVICTNAGNSMVVGMRRVADEMAQICPPLAAELALTADELRLSGDSARALHRLAERVDVPSVRALISTLTQSMRYGTPITQALRTLSRTERIAHMVALEEAAAKLAPKMVLPMMVFILPAVCAVAAGPAMIQLVAMLQHLR